LVWTGEKEKKGKKTVFKCAKKNEAQACHGESSRSKEIGVKFNTKRRCQLEKKGGEPPVEPKPKQPREKKEDRRKGGPPNPPPP